MSFCLRRLMYASIFRFGIVIGSWGRGRSDLVAEILVSDKGGWDDLGFFFCFWHLECIHGLGEGGGLATESHERA